MPLVNFNDILMTLDFVAISFTKYNFNLCSAMVYALDIILKHYIATIISHW